MKKVDTFFFYLFSKGFYDLRGLQAGDFLYDKEVFRRITAAKIWLTFFNATTIDLALPHTREISQQINDFLETERIVKFLKETNDKEKTEETEEAPENIVLNQLFIERVHSWLDEFERFFSRESKSSNIYTVTKKGIYDTDALVTGADQRFPESVRKCLPNTSIYDFKEAGKCLAFEVPTAMAFHILRGTESLILRYYEALSGQAWSFNNRNWGEYIRQLKVLNAPIEISQRLDEIRKFERNPILHPEHIVSLEKALPLFELVGGVVILMALEIERIEATSNTSP